MALMWSGVSSDDEFGALGAHESDMLGRELRELREAEMNMRFEMWKGLIKVSGGRVG